jgi:hypothetical protein
MGNHRTRGELLLTLSPTPDSVFAGRYLFSARSREVTRIPDSVSAPPREARGAFGQLFAVRRVDGVGREVLGRAKRAVLIWWSVTPDCSAWLPTPATRAYASDVVVSARPRPADAWIDGMPTFDMSIVNEVYDSTAGGLSPGQFRELRSLLPYDDDSVPAQAAAWRRIIAWADAHPAQASRPAATRIVCAAQQWVFVEQRCVPHAPARCVGSGGRMVISNERVGALDLRATIGEVMARCDPVRWSSRGSYFSDDTTIVVGAPGLRLTGIVAPLTDSMRTRRLPFQIDSGARVLRWLISGIGGELPFGLTIGSSGRELIRRAGAVQLEARHGVLYATSRRLPGLEFAMGSADTLEHVTISDAHAVALLLSPCAIRTVIVHVGAGREVY